MTTKKTSARRSNAASKTTTTPKQKQAEAHAANNEPKPITAAMADRLVAMGIMTAEQRAEHEAAGLIRSKRTPFFDHETEKVARAIYERVANFNASSEEYTITMRVTRIRGEAKASKQLTAKVVGLDSNEGDDE